MTPKEAIDKIVWTPLMRMPNEQSDLKEALYMACNALEKADKYRWHNLRKNPNDLPPKTELLEIVCPFGSGYMYVFKTGTDYYQENITNAIAWRLHEGFEVEE